MKRKNPKATGRSSSVQISMSIGVSWSLELPTRYKIVMEGPDGVRFRKLNQIGH